MSLTPIHFQNWLEENKDQFKPPVGNKMIWPNREFIVMVVGGPNARTDFHVNEGEEYFHQLKGNIVLQVMEGGKPRDIEIKEGEIFLLPPKVPHSPKRPAGSLGMVIERRRREGEQDGLQWYCEKCNTKLYEEFFTLKNIELDFPPVFDRFFNSAENSTCKKCNLRQERAGKKGA